MNTVLLYILYFFFYSAAGWLVESTYCSIGERKLINRGFLLGPICPIYGKGALVLSLLIYNPFKDRPLLVFLLGMVFCDILEYAVSFIMEKLFNARWWDYEGELFNLNGRICFKHTIYWGIIATIFVKTIHPAVEKLFAKIPENVITIAVCIILPIFIADLIYAVIRAVGFIKIKNGLDKLVEAVTLNADHAMQQLDEKFLTVKETVESKYDTLLYTITDKADELNKIIDNGNYKLDRKREEIIIDAKLFVESFERKLKPYNPKETLHAQRREFLNKYGKKFRSGDIKVIIDELKQIYEDIKNKIIGKA